MTAKDKDSHTGRKVAAGVVAAGVAGYVAGILTAPKSGKETRQDIKTAAKNARIEAERHIKDLQAEIDDLIAIAKTKGVDLNEVAKKNLNDAMTKAQDAKAKSKTVVTAVKKGEADNPDLDAAVKQLKEAKDNLAKYLKS